MSARQDHQDLQDLSDLEEREDRELGGAGRRGVALRLARVVLSQKSHRLALIGGMAMIAVGTAATVLEPRLFGYAIDDAIVPRRWDLLEQVTILYLLAGAVRVTAMIAQGYLFEVLGQNVTQELRLRLFDRLQRSPMSMFDRNPAGRLLTRVTNDVASLSEMFSAGFVTVVSNVLLVVGILGYLLVLDLRLGLIAAAVFPLLVMASVHFSNLLTIAYRESRSRLSSLNAFLAESILGVKVIHLFNRERQRLARFDRLNQWYADAQIDSVKVFALFQPSITLSVGIAMALVIGYGGQAALDGSIKPGVLVSFFAFVLTLFQPVREIADKWNLFLSGMASAERIFSILEWPTEIEEEESRGPARALQLRGHVRFENVWFAYESERWVLKDFSIDIPAGARVGIVGHTGAGKTTFISLLMRFYEPQKGRILIDGRDIREYGRRELRAAIGIVQQDVFLYSGTVADNVGFWDAERSARVAELMPESIGTEVRERGNNLSMGERQIVAFARAAAAEPSLWILDEATANLDSATEATIQRELMERSRGKTLVIIAHRLATIRAADLILVLNRGVLVEQGVHDQLVRLDGLYARLHRYQQAQRELTERESGTGSVSE